MRWLQSLKERLKFHPTIQRPVWQLTSKTKLMRSTRLAARTASSSAMTLIALKAFSRTHEKRLAYESELPSRHSDTWFILDHTKQTGQPIDLSPTGPAHIDQVSLMDVNRRVKRLRKAPS